MREAEGKRGSWKRERREKIRVLKESEKAGCGGRREVMEMDLYSEISSKWAERKPLNDFFFFFFRLKGSFIAIVAY